MYLLSMEQSFTGLIDAGVRLTKERESKFVIVVVWVRWSTYSLVNIRINILFTGFFCSYF